MINKQGKKLNKFNIPNNAINIYGNHPAKSALLSSNRSCYLICTTEKKFDYWNNFLINNKINNKELRTSSANFFPFFFSSILADV